MTQEMNESTPQKSFDRREAALNHCKKLERGQKLSATSFQWAYFLSQFAAVVFSGITPILILLDNTPKYVQAIPPAIASIAAGLAVYNWRVSGVRSRIAAESLESERLDYELRIGSKYGSHLPDDEALVNFRDNVTKINLGVLREWQSVVIQEANQPNHSKSESQEGL